MIRKTTFLLGFILASFIGAFVGIAWYQYHMSSESPSAVPTYYTPSFARYAASYTLDTASTVVPAGLNFVYAAKTTISSVVHVQEAREGGYSFWRPSQRGSQRKGSGVIISSDGYIVTNHHVVEDAESMEVILSDNRSYEAKVIGKDPTTDLVLLKVDAQGLSSVQMGDSDKLEIGEWVLAVGNPFEFRSTVTAGIVSAKARNLNTISDPNNMGIESFIQTDAVVNLGNSGGALVNLRGELVGINTVIYTHTGAYTGYSFAVPVSLVRKVTEDLKAYGEVRRALLGVQIGNVNASVAKIRGLQVIRGVVISEVYVGSAAERAGLREDDVILSVNNTQVSNVSELQELIARRRPGDYVAIAYIRDDTERTVRVKLQSAAAYKTRPSESLQRQGIANSSQGLVLRELSDEDRNMYNLYHGVRVMDIRDRNWTYRGLRKGFVITHINKKRVLDVPQALRLLETARLEGQALIEGRYDNGSRANYTYSW